MRKMDSKILNPYNRENLESKSERLPIVLFWVRAGLIVKKVPLAP